MASFVKFDCFVADIGLEVHQLNTDTLMVYLTNATPVAGNTVYNTPADISTKNGYTQRGKDVTNTWSQTSGTATLAIGADLVWTGSTVTDATGFGPFRYAVMFNEDSATDALIGYWDYGAAITVMNLETFTFDMTTSLFTLA
jgi:hypothetical protein